MIALFTLLAIIVLSVTVVRIAGIALELTGLSPEIASFQAQSAFSGAGFTTTESETIVTHPVRRRIIRVLILLGSAGISTSIATLVLTFVGESGKDAMTRGLILLGGLIVIFFVARSKHVYHIMKVVITRALQRWTTMRIFDYEELLGFSEGYSISRVVVKKKSWMAGRSLNELKLEKKGVLVLAIYRKVARKEKFIGSISGETVIEAADVLICYSPEGIAKSLAENMEAPAAA